MKLKADAAKPVLLKVSIHTSAGKSVRTPTDAKAVKWRSFQEKFPTKSVFLYVFALSKHPSIKHQEVHTWSYFIFYGNSLQWKIKSCKIYLKTFCHDSVNLTGLKKSHNSKFSQSGILEYRYKIQKSIAQNYTKTRFLSANVQIILP